ncbi:MAG: peptidylprolyl isomerase [Planctomycetaceae bacterium]|nr:peptidylprolyl isomerase [Planctomycetaceae bacterium]
MRSVFYTVAVLASIGTVAAVVSNPQIVQQGSALLGLVNEEVDKPDDNNSGGDMLSQFLRSNDNESLSNSVKINPMPSTETPPPLTVASLPAFPSAQNTQQDTQNTPRDTSPPIDIVPMMNAYSNSTPQAPESSAVSTPFSSTSLPTLPDNITPPNLPPQPAPSNSPFAQPANTFPLPEMVPIPVVTTNPPETNTPAQPTTNIQELDRWSDPIAVPATATDLPLPNNDSDGFASSRNSPVNSSNPPVEDLFSSQNVSVVEPNIGTIFSGEDKNVGVIPPVDSGSIFPDANPPANSPDTNIFSSTQPITQPTTPPTTPLISPEPSTALPLPATSNPLVSESRHGSELAINPSVIAEEIPCIGTEMVARVGCEVILMCDILPHLRKFGHQVLRQNLAALDAEKRDAVTEEEKEKLLTQCIEMNYPEFLKMQIEGALVYNDFLMTMPREQVSAYEKRLNEEFDRKDLPAMVKEFGVGSVSELKQFLTDKLGSSLERERTFSTRNKIIQMWVARSVQDAEADSTYDELNEYYRQHIGDFTTKERVRWKEMVVLYSKFNSKQEAWNKINWFVGEVRRGVDFEGLAKLNSDGLTAPEGGVRDWTKRGDLSSKLLENKIFEMPTKQLSDIIEAENGFHVVLVTDHEREKIVPFIDAQTNIRKKVKLEKLQKKQTEYFENLKQKFYVIVLRKEFNLNVAKPISRPLK